MMVVICNAASFTQEKIDSEKLYAEIAGDYEFDYMGDTGIITFFVKDGVLMGRDNVQDEGTPLVPVEGKDLEFTATSDEGEVFTIVFSRDESGNITKCNLATADMELSGVKIKK